MYARQRTALRCYLRRLLGCFRHSGRSQRPEYRRAFRKTLRLHAVLRIALIHTRQRTALRCYLRRLAPLVRPPQPPKIDFVNNSRASAKCSSENRAGCSLGARRPAIRTAHSRGLRRLRPEICAENLKKSPENTKNNKKSMQIVVRYNYSYYFWGKRSVEMRRESRCCCVNIGNLQ